MERFCQVTIFLGQREEKIRQMRANISAMCEPAVFPYPDAMLEVDSTKTDSRMDKLRTIILDVLNA